MNVQTHTTPPRTTIVIGGGLAGIAAAVRLAQQGQRVTLVETRQRLGGRATSFTDPTTGQLLDNCQHVLLGCCTNLLDLYDRLGVPQKIDWHPRLYFAFPNKNHYSAQSWVIDALESDDLPAPLHLSASLLAFRGLTVLEKLAIAKGMLAVMQAGRLGRAQLHTISFADWLASVGQPMSLIEKFWGPVVVSAINELPGRMSADAALQVFQEGMLAHRNAYVMGLAAVPLVQLYDPAEALLQRTGGELLLSTSAHQLQYDATTRRVVGLEIDQGRTLTADAYVSALPFDRLAKLSPQSLRETDARLQGVEQIQVSPIIGIHLVLEAEDDQPVMELPHLVVTGTMIQWLFNKGMVDHQADEVTDEAGQVQPTPTVRGQHLHAVISAAHAEVNEPASVLIERALREVRSVLPKARQAKLLHGRVVKEKRATFSAAPGLNRYRPMAGPRGEQGDAMNLYLAGDWCQTGWPATMEGAVRSGYLAAEALLRDQGHDVKLMVNDLQPSALYELIGRR